MVSEIGNLKVSGADEVRQEIDSLLADIAALSDAGLSAGEFYPALLERAVFAISALSGEVWLADGDDRLKRVYHVDSGARPQPPANTLRNAETGLLEALRGRESKIVEPGGRKGTPIVACPIVVGGRPWGVLALWISADVPQGAYRGFLKFGAAVAGFAVQYQQRIAMAELTALATTRTRFDAFCESVYGAWSPREVAVQIANEGRLLLDCDRLSVAVFRGRRCRISAVSGATDIGRGNEQVARLQRLVDAASRLGQPFFYSDDTTNLAPQVEKELVAFLDESTARRVAIVPLLPSPDSERKGKPPRPVGALVVEQFTHRPVEELATPLLSMSRHAAMALDRSLRIAQIPWLVTLLRRLRSTPFFKTLHLSKWTWRMVAFLGAVAALGLLQTDFDITVRGELRPVNEQFVFAPMNGIITNLETEHGKTVDDGALLMTLRSTELDLESARIRGELLTTQQRLAAIGAERLQIVARGERADQETNRLSADELTLRARIANLRKEYDILEEQKDRLRLTSPMSGTVLTWDLKRTLESRPVRRGQALLSVGDLRGPWMLKLRVPDEQIGHIQSAIDRDEAPANIAFVLATQPNTQYAAKTREIGIASQVQRPDDGPIVLLTADFDRDAVADLRPGAGVVAKVHCGRASYLYVWLHGFFEEISRRFF